MLVEQIKDQTSRGWTYDGADASFELLARRCLGHMPSLFELVSFEATGNCRWSQQGELVTGYRAAAEITVDGKTWSATSEGHGLLGTMNEALRKILLSSFPRLSGMRLVGIKTRSVSTQANAKPVTQVILESHDEEVPEFGSWFTVGASASEFEASLMALRDAVTYRLLR
jgi:2-isopropylmalate synthase